MTNIVPGTNATIKSSTAEGQLLETIMFLQIQEATTAKNPQNFDGVQGSFSINTLIFNSSFSFTAEQSINSSGQVVISVPNYLTGVTFTPGSNGTFKSANAAAYLVEVASYLQSIEFDTTKNTQNRNYVSATFNADTNVFSGTSSLPIELALDSTGAVKLTAVPYLL